MFIQVPWLDVMEMCGMSAGWQVKSGGEAESWGAGGGRRQG